MDLTTYELRIPATLSEEHQKLVLKAFSEGDSDAVEILGSSSQPDVYLERADCHLGRHEFLINEVLAELRQVGVTVPVQLFEAPAGEYLGVLCRYTPALGLHMTECDSYGLPVLTLEKFQTIKSDATTSQEVLEHIEAALGTAWDNAHN